ncbi:MAG: AAA family ATPase [Desulfovibrionales bacterium]|nr:AAA family ATPase [Desulfovibrionales bacterium]
MDKRDILSRLDFKNFYKRLVPTLREHGGQAIGLCPWHDDRSPSLSVNLKTGLYYCHACGAKGDVFTFYQQLNNVDFHTALKEIGEMTSIKTEPQRVVSRFEYSDLAGNILYAKERLEPGSNGRSKEFRFKHPVGDKWQSGRGGEAVPYRLPELARSKYAFIVEGEAKADLLHSWGLAATCLDSGASSPWHNHYLQYFADKEKMVILPDNDTPGRDYAKRIAVVLHGNVGQIKIVALPGLQEKGDVIDWTTIEGNNKQRLLAVVQEADEWKPQAKDLSFLMKGSDLAGMDIKVEWAVKDFIPKQGITLLHGKGGIGKTWLSFILADAVSKGMPFTGIETQAMPVVYIDLENPLPAVIERVRKIGCDNVLFWHAGGGKKKPPKLDGKDFLEYADLPPGALLIFDTLRAAQSGDENKSQDMALVMNNLKTLRDGGFTILLLHHTPKGNDRTYKGSTAIFDLADHVLGLHKVRRNNLDAEVDDDEDTDCYYRFGTKEKTRYQPFHVFLAFDPEKGFVPAPDPDEEAMKDLHGLIVELKASSGDWPIQGKIVEKAKEVIGLSRDRTLRLLGKGEKEKLWTSESLPSKKNAKVYRASSVFEFSGTIYSQKTRKLAETEDQFSGKHTPPNSPGDSINTEFSSFREGLQKTQKTDSSGVGCLTYQETGRCPGADWIEEQLKDEALYLSLEEEQGALPWS